MLPLYLSSEYLRTEIHSDMQAQAVQEAGLLFCLSDIPGWLFLYASAIFSPPPMGGGHEQQGVSSGPV